MQEREKSDVESPTHAHASNRLSHNFFFSVFTQLLLALSFGHYEYIESRKKTSAT